MMTKLLFTCYATSGASNYFKLHTNMVSGAWAVHEQSLSRAWVALLDQLLRTWQIEPATSLPRFFKQRASILATFSQHVADLKHHINLTYIETLLNHKKIFNKVVTSIPDRYIIRNLAEIIKFYFFYW